jgi:hypothetical protein
MNRIKKLIQNAPVHERHLEFRSCPLEGDRLVVEGQLRDELLVQGYNWDGSDRPKGTIHLMCVRMLVAGWPLSIIDAEAEMPDVIPHERCPTTLDSVKKVIGLSIASGYSEEVHKRIGGHRGCTHLTHLILAMGTAALHGFWANRSREKRPIPQSMDDLPELKAMRNSCKLWTEDGPIMQHLSEIMEKARDDAQ